MAVGTRSRTKATHDFAVNLSSPVHKLPTELLSEIFVLSVATFGTTDFQRRVENQAILPAQLLPGAVCHLWRKISCRTPRLWAKLLFCFAKNKRKLKLHEQMLSQSFERSGTLPLEVYMTLNVQRHATDKIRDIGVAALRRAAKVCVAYDNALSVVYFMSNLFLVAPSARMKDCVVYSMESSTRMSFRISAPNDDEDPHVRMTRLSLRSSGHIIDLTQLPLPDLEALSLSAATLREELPLTLQRFPQLRELELDLDGRSSVVTVTSSSLTHLSIIEDPTCTQHSPSLTPHLDCLPRLQHLSLQFHQERTWSILPFVWPDLPALKSLTFRELAHWDPGFTEMLQHAPQLISIHLKDTQCISFFQALFSLSSSTSPDSSESPAGQGLRYIRVTSQYDEDDEDDDEDNFDDRNQLIAGYMKQFLSTVPNSRVSWWVDTFLDNLIPVCQDFGSRFERNVLGGKDIPPLSELDGLYDT